MTDDLWAQLIDTIDPLRYDIGADIDGSTWHTLCCNLSAMLAPHGWPPLVELMTQAWGWLSTEQGGESLSLMIGTNDRLFLALERGEDVIREQDWYL